MNFFSFIWSTALLFIREKRDKISLQAYTYHHKGSQGRGGIHHLPKVRLVVLCAGNIPHICRIRPGILKIISNVRSSQFFRYGCVMGFWNKKYFHYWPARQLLFSLCQYYFIQRKFGFYQKIFIRMTLCQYLIILDLKHQMCKD